jgi:hypothetical protein
MKIISEASEYKFEFDESASIFKFIWKNKLFTTERFKEIVCLFASNTIQLKPQFLFVDARLNKFTMTLEIQNWHDQTIIPMYKQAKVKAMAFLIPQNVFSEMTHKQTFNRKIAKETLPTEFFNSEQDILDWFNSYSLQQQ